MTDRQPPQVPQTPIKPEPNQQAPKEAPQKPPPPEIQLALNEEMKFTTKPPPRKGA